MPTTVTALAERAATAVHELAHLARPAITTLEVQQLGATTGALTDLAAALPQTLRQLQAYLTLSHDPGDTAKADPARDCLRQAAALAAHLAAALDAAHQALGHLAETDPNQARGVKFRPAIRGQFSTGVDSEWGGKQTERELIARSHQTKEDISSTTHAIGAVESIEMPFFEDLTNGAVPAMLPWMGRTTTPGAARAQLVLDLVRSELGLWALSAEHMTFGHGSVTYDVDTGGRHLIVRTNDDPAVFAGTDATLAQLRAAGIPVPTALAVDLSCRRYPFAWMVLEKIPGRDLRYDLPSMTEVERGDAGGSDVPGSQRLTGAGRRCDTVQDLKKS